MLNMTVAPCDNHAPFRRASDSARSRAFTLVELLVVIGIIAVLISILIPTLSKAQAAARRTACMSNLRQLGVGMGQYLVAYKNTFPGHKERLDVVDPFWGDAILPYLKTKDIFRCPDMAPNDTRFDNGTVWKFEYKAEGVSYGYNAYFLGHACYNDKTPEYNYYPIIPPKNWVKVTQVRKTYECLMFADSSPPYVFSLWWPYAATTKFSPGNEGVTTRRHKGVGCVVFVDGHCEMRTDKEINPRLNPAQFSDRTNVRYWDPKQRVDPKQSSAW